MTDQGIVIVGSDGTEHEFPAGMDPKKAAAIVRQQEASGAQPAAAPQKRPLLIGRSEANVPAQLRNDPEAVKAFQSAKDTGADVGIAAGAMGLGGALAPASITGPATAFAKSAGQIGLYGGAYKGLTAMGIPPEYAGLILAATGLKSLTKGGGSSPAKPEPVNNTGGRLVTTKAPGINQQMADALAELRQPMKPDVVELPPRPSLPAGYVPRSTVPQMTEAIAPNSANAGGRLVRGPAPVSVEQGLAEALAELRAPQPPKSVELAPPPQLPPGYTPRTSLPVRMVGAKSAATPPKPTPKPTPKAGPPEVQRNLSVIRQPGDMPKSWHAFMNPEARAQAGTMERQGISSLHRELNNMDASYRAATAGERAMLQGLPQAYKDALVQALLNGARQ